MKHRTLILIVLLLPIMIFYANLVSSVMAQDLPGNPFKSYQPKPAHFIVLGTAEDEKVFNEKNSASYKFNLIDTDGDLSDYELIEYIRSSTFDGFYSVLERGMIKAVEFRNDLGTDDNEPGVQVYGIWLDDNDLSNYAPAIAIFQPVLVGNDFIELFKEALTLPECRAIYEVRNWQDYRDLHEIELNNYTRKLYRKE